MPAHRKDARASEMLLLYEQGYSLAQIAKAFGITRQAVFKILKRREYRARKPKLLPFVVWNEAKYTVDSSGYYRRTDDDRRRLHVDMWEQANGPTPEGYEVHHVNGDKTDNRLDNFELLTSSEHGKRHGFGGNQYTGSLGSRPVKW